MGERREHDAGQHDCHDIRDQDTIGRLASIAQGLKGKRLTYPEFATLGPIPAILGLTEPARNS